MAKAKPSPTVLNLERDRSIPGRTFVYGSTMGEEGMPVQRKGRMVRAFPSKLNRWLGRESHEPVQIATETPISLPS